MSKRAAPKQQLSDGIATLGGRESLEDDGRSGRPTTSINEETVKSVEKLVMDDRIFLQRDVPNLFLYVHT